MSGFQLFILSRIVGDALVIKFDDGDEGTESAASCYLAPATPTTP